MAAITAYTLNTAEQLDLFYSEDGNLNLEVLMNLMSQKAAPIDVEGKINGEGFINPRFDNINGSEMLVAYGVSLVNLGNYFEPRFENDVMTSREEQYNFYSKAYIIITKDSTLILKFDNSVEEKVRSKVKALVEDLGFEASVFKLDNELLREIQHDQDLDWSAAKIDRIDKDGDKTTKVSYEIDLADNVNSSQVDDHYRNSGKLSHLKFQLPYDAIGSNDKITISHLHSIIKKK